MALDTMIVLGVGIFLGAAIVLCCLLIVKKIYWSDSTEGSLPMWAVKETPTSEMQTSLEGLRSGHIFDIQHIISHHGTPEPPSVCSAPWDPKPVATSPGRGFCRAEAVPETANIVIDCPDSESQWSMQGHDSINGQSQGTSRGKHKWSISAKDLVVFVEASTDGQESDATSGADCCPEEAVQGDSLLLSSKGECRDTLYFVDEDKGSDRTEKLFPETPPSLGNAKFLLDRGEDWSSDDGCLSPGQPVGDMVELVGQNLVRTQCRGPGVAERPQTFFQRDVASLGELPAVDEGVEGDEEEAEDDDDEVSIESSLRAVAETDIIDTACSRLQNDGHHIFSNRCGDTYELDLDIDLAYSGEERHCTTPRAIDCVCAGEADFAVPRGPPSMPVSPVGHSRIPRPPPQKMRIGLPLQAPRQPSRMPRSDITAAVSQGDLSHQQSIILEHQYKAQGIGLNINKESGFSFSDDESCETVQTSIGCQSSYTLDMVESSTNGSATQESSSHLMPPDGMHEFSVTRNLLFNEKDATEVLSVHNMASDGDVPGSEWAFGSLSSISDGELELFISDPSDQLRQWESNDLFVPGRTDISTG